MFLRLMIVTVMFTFSNCLSALGADVQRPVHLDRKIMPTGCASCHVGFDFSSGGGSVRCLNCHGPASPFMLMKQSQTRDVSKDFSKMYRHPTFDKRGIHSAKESMPETNPAAPRHAECADCHSTHYLTVDSPYAGLRGKKTGNFAAPITKEYELCYLCHAESANLPLKSTNKRLEFVTTNASFHPVEAEGKNLSVISLIRPYRERKKDGGDVSVIKCADCHGSDDSNAPRGPHGSRYQGILTDNYAVGDGLTENTYNNARNYALCYRCHKQSSILGNESFPLHSRHINGDRNSKGGTSCHTCHSSHGSIENRYLIRFNREFVTESSTGKLKFVEKGINSFHGECWLTCHGVDHNPKSY